MAAENEKNTLKALRIFLLLNFGGADLGGGVSAAWCQEGWGAWGAGYMPTHTKPTLLLQS